MKRKEWPTKEVIIDKIKISINFTDLMKNLGICRKPKNIIRLKQFVTESNIDLLHTNPNLQYVRRTKYQKIKKECPCCKCAFETQIGHPKEKTHCSRQCSNSFIKKILSSEQKKKISDSLNEFHLNNGTSIKLKVVKQKKKQKTCIICGSNVLTRRNKTCGGICLTESLRRNGIKSSNKSMTRSKNEILFCELVKEKFSSTIHNEPIFNGWDADVIIPELRIAILWNGNWHHKKITKKHSVLQVQNRDKIKIEEIKKYGYNPYVIDDFGKYNEDFVREKFSKFIADYSNSNLLCS